MAVLGKLKAQKMGKLLISHRSTTYPCYLPVLGRFVGAGRIRLTHCKCNQNGSKSLSILFRKIILAISL